MISKLMVILMMMMSFIQLQETILTATKKESSNAATLSKVQKKEALMLMMILRIMKLYMRGMSLMSLDVKTILKRLISERKLLVMKLMLVLSMRLII